MHAHNDEGPLATPALEEELTTTPPGVRDSEQKRFATLRARLALRGFQMHRQADGRLLVIRWNLAKTLPSLDAAERFAEQAGCQP